MVFDPVPDNLKERHVDKEEEGKWCTLNSQSDSQSWNWILASVPASVKTVKSIQASDRANNLF